MRVFYNLLFFLGIFSISVSVVSCSDNDNNRESNPFALLMRGAYNGGMFINENVDGESVNAMVVDNMVSLQGMPFSTVYEALSGYISNSDALQGIESLDYPVFFTPTFANEQNGDILMELDVDDIYLSTDDSPVLCLDMEPGSGRFYNSEKLMLLDIYINNIFYVINDENIPVEGFIPMQLTFELYKK